MNNYTIDINLTQEVHAVLPLYVQDIFSCYSLAAKNIRNKTVFCISNIQSAYLYSKETNNYSLKSNLHINEQTMISNANHVISLLNKKSLDKAKSNEDNEKEPKLLKEFSLVIDKNTYFQSVNKTLIENLIKYIEDNGDDKFKDYT